jgi:hypothetical protein
MISMFMLAMLYFVFINMLCVPAILTLTNPDYTRPSFYVLVAIALIVITPISVGFGCYIYYLGRSKKRNQL